MESLVRGKLVSLFKEKGIDISETYSRATAEREDSEGVIQRKEVDIIVANGKEVVLVEVKNHIDFKGCESFFRGFKRV